MALTFNPITGLYEASQSHYSTPEEGGKYAGQRASNKTLDQIEADLRNEQIRKGQVKMETTNYASEFIPIGETEAGRNALTALLSNPDAGGAERAGAAMALYPGMDAEVQADGTLKFTAIKSDLGFKYPNQMNTPQKQAAERFKESSLGTDRESIQVGVTNAIDQLSQTTDLREIAEISGRINGELNAMRQQRMESLRSTLYAEGGVSEMQEALNQSVKLDNQFYAAHNYGVNLGDTIQTQNIRNTLANNMAMADKRLAEQLQFDPEMSVLEEQMRFFNARAAALTNTMAIPVENLPTGWTGFTETFAAVKGDELTIPELRDLENKYAAGDKEVRTLYNMSAMQPNSLFAYGNTLPDGQMKNYAIKQFDAIAGAEGTWKALEGQMREMESKLNSGKGKEFTEGLRDDDKQLLTTPQVALSRASTSQERQEILDNRKQLIATLTLTAARNNRDAAWTVKLLDNPAVPEDEELAEAWKTTLDKVKAERAKAIEAIPEKERRTRTDLGAVGAPSLENLITRVLTELDASKITLDTNGLPQGTSLDRIPAERTKALAKFLSTQGKYADGYKVFGPVGTYGDYDTALQMIDLKVATLPRRGPIYGSDYSLMGEVFGTLVTAPFK